MIYCSCLTVITDFSWSSIECMGSDVFSSSLSECFMDGTSTACDGTSIVFEYVQPQSFAGPVDGIKITFFNTCGDDSG